MASAYGNFLEPVYDKQQMAAMHPRDFGYQDPYALQAANTPYPPPFGYGAEPQGTGEPFGAQPVQHPAPHDGSGFQIPHLHPALRAYNHPHQFHFQTPYMEAPFYVPYAHQNMPVFHEQHVMHEVYPNAEKQHFTHMHGAYHALYHPQFAHQGAPQVQEHYAMISAPADHHHRHQSTPLPEMEMTHKPPVEVPNPDAGSAERNPGHKSHGKRRPGPHNCAFPDCGRVYTKSALLRAHMRTHSENIYHCNWGGCGRKFSLSDELARHMRKHTGQRHFRGQQPRLSHFNHLEVNLKTQK